MQTRVPPACLLLLFLCVPAVGLASDASLRHVRAAQLRLGGETWSRIVEIENTGDTARYPRTLHALVFELAGLLWFYTPSEGTQSFSLHRNNLEAEKRDFGPSLRDIHAGFTRWREVNGGPARAGLDRELPNGCFIDSVVALRERLAAGEAVRNPRLVSYYIETAHGVSGHTVLAYEAAGRVAIVDPARPKRSIRLKLARADDPLALARALEGRRVARARQVRLDPATEPTLVRVEPVASEAQAPRAG